MRPAQSSDSACILRSVSVSFDNTEILDDITIAFPARSCTVVMGPSGSGKSTLLKTAAGLIVPETGSVEILGVDPVRASDRELERLRGRHGFVFQDDALWQNMTLFGNIALPLRYHAPDLDEGAVRARVTAMVREFGTTRRLEMRPSQVSAGERKITSMVRALITDPELLFLDEPTSSVDSERADLVIRKLRDLKSRGLTLIAITHDARIASQIADYVAVLKDGRVLAFGALRDIARSGDPQIERILTDVLSETATYDGDILELLDLGSDPFPD